jgi:cellulose synthase/poly-beta-1,6-N-acetylglucosamine synthase-like glycosyltransferase
MDIYHFPKILIVIPTYNEPLSVLRRTLDAVMKIEYDHSLVDVVVGDDQKRTSLRDMIDQEYPSVRYHTRQYVEGHAKAGNVNDILFTEPTDAEFVLILDCDMAPEPDILHKMIPYFYTNGDTVNDKKGERDITCAFVQSPQHFENIVGVDFLGQHYHFFYQIVLECYGAFQRGPPCCGTNVMFDRWILLSIDGFQYGSITEDFLTSMHLHAKGYHSRYCKQKTAVGYAPTSLNDFFQQRGRWSTGGLQIIFTTSSYVSQFWSLPASHRWIYGFSAMAPIFSIFMTILFFGPVLDLLGYHFNPYSMSTIDYIYAFLPYAVMYTLMLIYLHRLTGIVAFMICIVESIFMVPFQLYYTLNFFVRHICGFQSIRFRTAGYQRFRFVTTPKATDFLFHDIWQLLDTFFLLLPFLFYITLGIGAIVYHYLWTSSRNISFRHDSEYHLDLFWLAFIMIQFSPPFLYLFQNLCIYLVTPSSPESEMEIT